MKTKLKVYLRKVVAVIMMCTFFVQGADTMIMAEEATIGNGAKIIEYDGESTVARFHFGRIVGATVDVTAAAKHDEEITDVNFTSSDASVCSVTKVGDHYRMTYLKEGTAQIIMTCKADGEPMKQTVLASSLSPIDDVEGIVKSGTTVYRGCSDQEGISSRDSEVKVKTTSKDSVYIDGKCNGYYRVHLYEGTFGDSEEPEDDFGYVKKGRVEIPVVKVVLPKEMTIFEGWEENINAEIIPEIATETGIKFKSSNTNVVKVDNNGNLKAGETGSAVVTAESIDNPKISAKCRVTVKPYIPVTGIKIIPDRTEVENGLQGTISVEITPSDASIKDCIWNVSDDYRIQVDPKGRYLARNPGVVTVSATTKDGGFTDSCKITVLPVEAKGVAIQETLLVNIGEVIIPEWQMVPFNATNKHVTWKSDNVKVAKVDQYGNITGVTEGSTTIHITTEEGGFTASCEVTVKNMVDDIWLQENEVEVAKGTKKKLVADVLPKSCTYKEIIWRSRNNKIASVEQDGTVTAKDFGDTEVIVYDQYTGAYDICLVSVTAGLTQPKLKMQQKKKKYTLSWNKQANATKYILYRKKKDDKKFEKIKTFDEKTTSHTLKSTKKGNKYKMKAYCAKTKEYSKYSDVVKIK